MRFRFGQSGPVERRKLIDSVSPDIVSFWPTVNFEKQIRNINEYQAKLN